MMRCPSYDRTKNFSLVSKGSQGIVANGITNKMSISGGIGKIISAVVFMHPGRFKKPPVVITG